jgi:protein-tyrosine kinase
VSNEPVLSSDLPRMRIGELLIEQGKLTRRQAADVAKYSIEHHTPFGEAAVSLGFVTFEDISQVMARGAIVPLPIASAVRERLEVLDQRHSKTSEGMKRLAKTLAGRWFAGNPGHSALTIISAEREEGRTTLAANLACIFALGGAKTLLVDGDGENPRLHALFDITPEAVPVSIEGPELVCYPIEGLDRLAVMTHDGLSDAESKILAPPFRRIVERGSEQFDIILIDTPAASRSNEFLLAAQATEGALVVSRGGMTRTRSSIKMLDACDDGGVKIVGGTMLLS